MLEIVDTDAGFFILEGSRAWPAGFDSYDLGNTLTALQAAKDDNTTPYDGMVIPRRADAIKRLRGAKIVAVSA